QNFSGSEVHMDATRQAGIEAADSPHDIDAFELLARVFLEDRGIQNCVFIWTGRSEGIASARVPWGWWIRVVIRYFPVADNHVMRKHSAHSFVETAADCDRRNFEVGPGRCASAAYLRPRLLATVQRSARSV